MSSRKITPLTIITFFILLLSSVSFSGSPNILAVIIATKGPAWVERSGWKYSAEKGMELTAGDKIEVGQQGEVKVKFFNRHTVRIGQGSELIVSKLEKEERSELVSVYLNVGQVMVEVWKRLGSIIEFSVETPSAIAGVKGTKFRVAVDDLGKTQVDVTEGRVELIGKADGSKITLTRGQSSVVNPGGKPELMQKKPDALRNAPENSKQGWGMDNQSGGTGGKGGRK